MNSNFFRKLWCTSSDILNQIISQDDKKQIN